MAELVCVRHGETDHNASGQICTHTTGASLSPLGRQQTSDLAERLATTTIAAIYSSPLDRAIETAELLSVPHELPVQPRDDLREVSAGELDGRSDLEAYATLNAALDGWSMGDLSLRIGASGETGHEVVARLTRSLRELVGRHPDSAVLVVTHGGLLQTAIPWICTNLEPEFGLRRHVRNAGVIHVRGSIEFECVAWDEVAIVAGA
jgi:probable phosphoglycerate mutase